MIRARLRAVAAILGVTIAAAVAIAVNRREPAAPPPPRPPAERPALLLLTSLPLMFAENFSLEGGGSPALKALQSRYRIVPISVTDEADLAKGRILLMAHPRAQPAEDLVALDQWVRGGGRVLLLADPMLEWASGRALGDPLRPPAMFMDTGLLAHWGLTLEAPEERGPKVGRIGGADVLTASPGTLSGSACVVGGGGLVAHCRIGKGHATVIADADFLNVDDLDGPTDHNLDALLDELAGLERK